MISIATEILFIIIFVFVCFIATALALIEAGILYFLL